MTGGTCLQVYLPCVRDTQAFCAYHSQLADRQTQTHLSCLLANGMICLSEMHSRGICCLMLSCHSGCGSFEQLLEAYKNIGDCLCGHGLCLCIGGKLVHNSHQAIQGLCCLHLGILNRSQDAACPAAMSGIDFPCRQL